MARNYQPQPAGATRAGRSPQEALGWSWYPIAEKDSGPGKGEAPIQRTGATPER